MHLLTSTTSYFPGKTLCLAYILVLHLLQKKPTFFQTRMDVIILFCDAGVFRISPDVPARLLRPACSALGVVCNFKDGPMLLIDSNLYLVNPPPEFCDKIMGVYVVQAASPAPSRGHWLKGSGGGTFVMEPWTWEEIVAGYASHHLH